MPTKDTLSHSVACAQSESVREKLSCEVYLSTHFGHDRLCPQGSGVVGVCGWCVWCVCVVVLVVVVLVVVCCVQCVVCGVVPF